MQPYFTCPNTVLVQLFNPFLTNFQRFLPLGSGSASSMQIRIKENSHNEDWGHVPVMWIRIQIHLMVLMLPIWISKTKYLTFNTGTGTSVPVQYLHSSYHRYSNVFKNFYFSFTLLLMIRCRGSCSRVLSNDDLCFGSIENTSKNDDTYRIGY